MKEGEFLLLQPNKLNRKNTLVGEERTNAAPRFSRFVPKPEIPKVWRVRMTQASVAKRVACEKINQQQKIIFMYV
jgi:hypothetical protein